VIRRAGTSRWTLLLQPDVAVNGPVAMVLLSPLIDLTFALAAAREELRRDPAIRAVDAVRLVNLYRWPDQVHVFQALSRLSLEASRTSRVSSIPRCEPGVLTPERQASDAWAVSQVEQSEP
jgi:hypothetical protein